MTRKWVALGGGVLALVLVVGTFDVAEARGGHGGHGSRGGHSAARSYSGPSFSARSYSAPRFVARSNFAGVGHIRHRRIGRAFVGVPLAYGAYGYGGCSWLRYRALDTGSQYWWSRYYDCINGYDY